MYRALMLLQFAFITSLTHAYESVGDERRWAMVGLNIIDVETGAVTPDQAIVIRNGTIESVRNSDALEYALIDIVVNLHGQYAIPGLWDMHIHLRGGPQMIDANERWLRQYLGYGVTAVREAGGTT